MSSKPLFDFTDQELKEAVRMKSVHVVHSSNDYYKEMDRREAKAAQNISLWVSILSAATGVLALLISLLK